MKRKEVTKGMVALCAAVMVAGTLCVPQAKAAEVPAGNAVMSIEDGTADIRATQYQWYYKEVNGKTYRRLYDATNQKWVTDWILCE